MAVAFQLLPQLGSEIMHPDTLISEPFAAFIALLLQEGCAGIHLPIFRKIPTELPTGIRLLPKPDSPKLASIGSRALEAAWRRFKRCRAVITRDAP